MQGHELEGQGNSLKLQEYQAKKIVALYGIPLPEGEIVATPQDARRVAARLGGKVVIKAQVPVGGRDKAGGIALVDGPDAAEAAARYILGMQIKGLVVRELLVEEAVAVAQELYLGLVVDRGSRRIVMMASAEGGVDIEEVARRAPTSLVRVSLDPFLGLRPYQIRELAAGIGLPPSLFTAFSALAQGLYDCFPASDATLVEINPLAVTQAGQLIALDAKILLDDNAFYRHPDWAALSDEHQDDPREREAREAGLSYVKLDGEIGCMVNGAGLAMATMDIIQHHGGRPANFLDIGGGARAERVAAALRIILADENVRAVLINIFGGLTRCDEVARGILSVLSEIQPRVPIIVRLVGTNEEEGRRILARANVTIAESLAGAAQKAVKAVRGVLKAGLP